MLKNNQKILIGILAVLVFILAWAPWMDDQAIHDKIFRERAKLDGTFGVCDYETGWAPFGRYVASCEGGYFVPFYYNPHERAQITKDRAMAIANSTEEVQLFLKLYPDADVFSIYEDPYPIAHTVNPVAGRGDPNPNPSWLITYSVKSRSTPPSSSFRIAISKDTGEIVAKYPKLEYVKDEGYCEKDVDCSAPKDEEFDRYGCYCVNSIHVAKGINPIMSCAAFIEPACKCISNICTQVE